MKLKILILSMLLAVSAHAQVKATVIATATGHSVSLSWTASTSTGVTGYNIYRGTTVGGESATAVNTSLITGTAYADATVIASTTYYYTAKSYCPTCSTNLSLSSNEVNAVIPADPQPAPPTGLTVGTVAINDVPLHWLPPVNQTGFGVMAYELVRGGDPILSSPSIIAVLPSWTISYTDPGCLTTCYYAAKAYDIKSDNSFVVSQNSNIVKAIVH
jgi:hypothetical protein